MSDVIRVLDEPPNRENRIIQAMADEATTHPEWQGDDKTIVLYFGREGNGLGVFGYQGNELHDSEAMADMLTSLMVLFEANGVTLSLVPITKKGRG